MDASTVAAKNAGSAVVTNGASDQDREVSGQPVLLPADTDCKRKLIGDGDSSRRGTRLPRGGRHFFTRQPTLTR